MAAMLSLIWLAVLVGWQGSGEGLMPRSPGSDPGQPAGGRPAAWFSPPYRQQETAPWCSP